MAMIKIIDNGLVYRGDKNAPHFCNAYWSSVVELSNGELLASMDISKHINSRDARSYFSISKDGGKNWSEPKVIWDDPNWRHPFHTTCRISQTPDGEVIGFMGIKNRSNLDQPHTNPETGGMVDMEHAVVRWDGKNQEWSKPEMINRPIDWKCYESCHWIFPVTSEKWLIPTAFRLNWEGDCPFGHKAFAFVSKDRGKSWPDVVDIFDLSSEDMISWEQKQTRLSDGRVFVVCWAFNSKTKENHRNRYTFSDDNCDSYGEVFESPLLGQTCTPLGLDDNHVICIYRRLDKKGLWAHIAKIEQNRWIPITEKLIWGGDVEAIAGGKDSSIQNQKKLQFGFPYVIRVKNGEVFFVFWCVENGLSNIRWFRLKVEI